MKPITFITGNQQKADYLGRYIGVPIKHQKMDLEEIQSLDLEEIVTHKVLPGPFIKFFLAEIGVQ
jgi:hypothetical protein